MTELGGKGDGEWGGRAGDFPIFRIAVGTVPSPAPLPPPPPPPPSCPLHPLSSGSPYQFRQLFLTPTPTRHSLPHRQTLLPFPSDQFLQPYVLFCSLFFSCCCWVFVLSCCLFVFSYCWVFRFSLLDCLFVFVTDTPSLSPPPPPPTQPS